MKYLMSKEKGISDAGFTLIEMAIVLIIIGIIIGAVSESVRHRFGVLAFPAQDSGKQRFFVFWRPKLLVRQFYYGYQGPEIRKIQQMLAKFRLYHDYMDGIVGKNLMKAIVEFQKQMGLRITGYPDQDTLFLMCNMKETGLYGANDMSAKTAG